MQTLQIDENNQLVISQNSLIVIDAVNACAQDTKTRIGIYNGENPLNIDEGIEFEKDILGKMGGQNYIREVVRNRILANDEIVQVNNISIEKIGDSLVLETEISSIYGVVNL